MRTLSTVFLSVALLAGALAITELPVPAAVSPCRQACVNLCGHYPTSPGCMQICMEATHCPGALPLQQDQAGADVGAALPEGSLR